MPKDEKSRWVQTLAQPEPNVLQCVSCQNEYFERFTINRLHSEQTLIPGQVAQTIESNGWPAYRCIVCGTLFFPQVESGIVDPLFKQYMDLMDKLGVDERGFLIPSSNKKEEE